MLTILAVLCILIGVGLLLWLCVIDLKEWILPNEIVLGFAATGILFHFILFGSMLTPIDMILGALAGGGSLLAIRTVANAYYGRDTLGLGDVKLMTAAGLWLGPYYSMIALAAGAFAGIIIGLIFLALPHEHPDDIAPQEGDGLMKTAIPAGPGFCAGIVVALGWMIKEWPRLYPSIDSVLSLFL